MTSAALHSQSWALVSNLVFCFFGNQLHHAFGKRLAVAVCLDEASSAFVSFLCH
jgi:hypothetical protein